jgi:hypothetical protein
MSEVSEVEFDSSSPGSIPDCYTDYELLYNDAPIFAPILVGKHPSISALNFCLYDWGVGCLKTQVKIEVVRI